MSPEERLTLLKTLILWSLSSSDAIQARIKESYKQSRRDDDINQPLSVQPWGTDARKRRYWLIEGRDDTHFRLYRESFPASPKRNTWWSVAGTIDELRAVADSLVEDRNVNSRRLSEKIYASIPRFEASEEKRKRRDYRLARKAAFARPEPGFSLYEGRTRGKKMKYTYSDDEDESSLYSGLELGGGGGARRSARNRQSSPVEQGPVYTASGRQVKTRQGGVYGEILSSRPLLKIGIPKPRVPEICKPELFEYAQNNIRWPHVELQAPTPCTYVQYVTYTLHVKILGNDMGDTDAIACSAKALLFAKIVNILDTLSEDTGIKSTLVFGKDVFSLAESPTSRTLPGLLKVNVEHGRASSALGPDWMTRAMMALWL
ncbi:hypothetical protein KEM56_006241 [Ascosphaera pollenicola]|nr:hypothetical protein KEM56_006241 [Ascosphaera pollenicola]